MKESLEYTKLIVETRFLKPGFDYWFSNHEHIRTPFPLKIKEETKSNTTAIFMDWVEGLKQEEFDAMTDDEFAEMFETILFNEAIKLVENEDEKLTIIYPFLPRVCDIVNHQDYGKGKIIKRKEIIENNKKMFEVSVQSVSNDQIWKTQFELG
jgi:hypothetical protein